MTRQPGQHFEYTEDGIRVVRALGEFRITVVEDRYQLRGRNIKDAVKALPEIGPAYIGIAGRTVTLHCEYDSGVRVPDDPIERHALHARTAKKIIQAIRKAQPRL